MGVINKSWSTIWVGTTDINCSNLSLFAENKEIHTIYQVHQDGDRFVDQIVSESDNMFANIRTIKCGSGMIVKTVNSDAVVPNIIESGSTLGLVTPNFPLDIIISGLNGDYEDGNGEYIITSFFQNDSPTYKSNKGWLIQRNADDYWYVIPPIANLRKLVGGKGGPVDSHYIQENCSGSSCPKATVIDKTNPSTPTPTPQQATPTPTQTPTPQPQPTPTPVSSSDIIVTAEEISDTKIKLHYDILNSSVKMWETEISNDISFKTKQTITGSPNTNFYEIKNLNHSTIYYIRTRVYNESERFSPWVNDIVNTTIPASSTNPTISLTNEKFPKISWNKPNVDFDYGVELIRTPEHLDNILLNSSGASQFIDSTANQEIDYSYKISFLSKNFKGSSVDLSIKVDKTAPIPPVLVPTNSATNNQNLVFEWNINEDVDHYLYKFNTSEWIKYKGNKLTIKGEEGENIFRIISIDSSENRSAEIIRKITIDITKPNPPVILSPTDSSSVEVKQKFKWSISDSDITSVSYKINNGTWNIVDKSITDVVLNLIQGKNSFKVKAIDYVGNESDISSLEIQIDSVPPQKPILKRIEKIVDISDNVTYDWSSSNKNDVAKWEYSFTKWGYGSTQPKSNWNNFLNVSSVKKNFIVTDGYSLFEIRAIDEMGNISEIASDLIDIDTNPPQMPTLKEPVINTNEDKTATGIFKWTISDDTHKVVFSLNNGTLIEKKNTEVQSHEFKLNQGLNKFKIYAEDARGNKSKTNALDTMVDTLPANKPKILGPHGECPNTLWKKLWEACQESKTGSTSTVRITYSIIPVDKIIGNFHVNGKSRTPSFRSESVPAFEEMVSHINNAFTRWKKIIESAFPNLNILFENIGFEQSNIPSAKNVMFKQSDQGDIRIAFVSNFEDYSEFVDRRYDNNSDLKTGVSDIYINTELNWSQPEQTTWSTIDIRLGLGYYIGKSLGLPENKNLTKGTSHLRPGLFNETEANDEDKNRFLKIYSLPNKQETIGSQFVENPIRYVNSNDLNISFSSDERVTIEYKYDFLSNKDSSLIVKSGQWNLHQPKDIKSGQIDLTNINHTESPSNKIRFYIRSVDSNGNKSDVTYCDYIILNTSDSCGVANVAEYCEQDLNLKIGNSCWDKYGLFSCMVGVNRNILDSEAITLRIKPLTHDFYILTQNIDLVAHSLFPDTEYSVGGYINPAVIEINEASEGFKYGFVNLTNLSEKQFKTQNSDKTPPTPIVITHISHASEPHPKNYTTPIGQLRKNGNYVPAMEIGWSKAFEDDFYKYELCVSESSIFKEGSLTKKFNYPNRDKVKEIVYLDKYSTDYYVKILAYDKSNNVSSSNVRVYKTVDANDAPSISDKFAVYYVSNNGFQTKYNEIPGSKWTIGFNFPRPRDLQFPTNHKIPDVEDALRKDYSDSDWLSLLGHLPCRVESKQWPGQSPTSTPTGYWISRNSVRDDNHAKLNNNTPTIKTNGDIVFKLSGFEQNTEYFATMFMYDITGHYITSNISFKTNKVEGDVTSPPKPTFNVNAVAYYNGKDYKGDDLSKYQWVLRFSWTLKNTNDLSKFLVLVKEEGDDKFTGGYYSIDRLEKTTDGSVNTYTGLVSGYKPNTKYLFKFNSVDTNDNWSEQGSFEFTTAMGDRINPPKPVISDVIRFIHPDYGNSFAFKVGQIIDSDVSLKIYLTKNLNEQDFYKFEQKWRIDRSNIDWEKWNLINQLEENVPYKVGFAWQDSAYNWSSVHYITLPKEARQLDGMSLRSSSAEQANTEFQLVNRIPDF